MTREIAPGRAGCFDATFPSTVWHETPCVSVPLPPHVPAHTGTGIRPKADVTADLPSPGIGGAAGNFTASVVGRENNSTGGTADSFSFQLNTNYFQNTSTQTLCQGSTTPASCEGWQQFIYQNTLGQTGVMAVQYWLVNFNGTCPANWINFAVDTGNDCYMNGPGHSITSVTAASAMANWTLEGIQRISPAVDDIFINQNGGATLYDTTSARIFNLDHWTNVEFNVFGHDGGSQAIFSAGSSATGKIQVFPYNSVFVAPAPAIPCTLNTSFTGETNNMTMSSCTPISGGISFNESVPCGAGLSACGGVCVDTSSDIHNCGGCGNTCNAFSGTIAVCTDGECGTVCKPGTHCITP